MKKQFKFLVLFPVCAISFSACQKNQNVKPVQAVSDTAIEQQTGKVKDLAIKRFMSISFGVDTANITYDAVAREYTLFGKLKMSRDTIEKRYSEANEYKANYEVNR